MPNTLVHLGIQSVSTKALFKGADFKWIAVGCIIPDVPWIIKRIITMSGMGINQYDLTQYTTVQASLSFCFLLCGMIALLCAFPSRVFILLAANAFIHLLLDAMQIKWGNGVHFLAPFSWKMTSFSLIWPEHIIIYVLTAAGFTALLYYGAKDWQKDIVFTRKLSRYAGAFMLLTVYCMLPFWLRSGPDSADNHYAATIRNIDERTGKYVELDRNRYRRSNNTVEVFSTEWIKVTGNRPSRDAILSIKGRFTDQNTIHISVYHVHSPLRDASSKIALAGVLLIWLAGLMKKRVYWAKHKNESTE